MNNKIPVAVLGATGTVGQRFVRLLQSHPWFEVVSVTGSKRSQDRCYAEAVNWVVPGELPEQVGGLVVRENHEPGDIRLAFSALPSSAAREVEPELAARGYAICSNASAMRMESDVPLLIPQINPDHVELIESQQSSRGWPGWIVTSPNCSTTGVVFPLKALDQSFGLLRAHVVTMQAISGAGYPGTPSLDILDNVIPYIKGEEEKIEAEPRKLLGSIEGGRIKLSAVRLSAQANRVPITDGHMVALSVELAQEASLDEVRSSLAGFAPIPEVQQLPSAPRLCMILRHEPDRPQTRRDRGAFQGMAVSVGRVRPCPVLDFKMISLVHNTLLGAAGGAILNAELLAARGYLGELPT